MDSPTVCGACGTTITVCPDCAGLLCTEGCLDREEDGCVCALIVEEDDEEDV